MLAICAFSLLMTSTPQRAYAYEDAISLELDVGYAGIIDPEMGVPPHAISFGVGGSIGLNDAWNLRLRLSHQLFPNGEQPTLHAFFASTEVYYMLDITTYVPFLGAGVDFVLMSFDGEHTPNFGLHVLAGMDFVTSRRVVFGFDFRFYFLPWDRGGGLETLSFNVNAKLTFLFDI